MSANEPSNKSRPAPAEDAARRPTVSKNLESTKPAEKTGALIGIVNLSLDAGDKGASTAFGLAQDVRGELRTAVDTGLDALENVVKGFFRVGKRFTARVDELAADLTASGERTVSGVIRSLRDTTRAASELASTAGGAIVGGAERAQA